MIQHWTFARVDSVLKNFCRFSEHNDFLDFATEDFVMRTLLTGPMCFLALFHRNLKTRLGESNLCGP